MEPCSEATMFPDAPLGQWEAAPVTAGEVIEVPLLLPGWQADALEAAARREGRTVGELARLLIRDFLSRPPHHARPAG